MDAKEEVSKLIGEFEKLKYYVDEKVALQLFLALNYNGNGISTVILEGEPGVGKTALVENLAKVHKYKMEYYQAIPTTSEESLIYDLDYKALVDKNSNNVFRAGKLTKVILNAIKTDEKVFLFLDEWEKTMPEADTFLLDFLQSGRLSGTPWGDIFVSKEQMRNIIVFIAKNDERDLKDTLMRRARRLVLQLPSPAIVRKALLSVNTNDTSIEMLNYLVNFYRLALSSREKLRKMVTIQELQNALLDDVYLVNAYDEQSRINNVLNNWFVKYDDDMEMMYSISNKLLFKYPDNIYEDLRLPRTADIFDITTVFGAIVSTFTDRNLLGKKQKIILWGSMLFITQLENYKYFKNPHRPKRFIEKIMSDSSLLPIENRVQQFLSMYSDASDSELALSLILKTPFIKENGEKVYIDEREYRNKFQKVKR